MLHPSSSLFPYTTLFRSIRQFTERKDNPNMKKSIIALALVVASVSAIGQGTVQFANLGDGVNAQVTIDVIGGTKAAAGYMAQLILVQGTSLTPVGAAANF